MRRYVLACALMGAMTTAMAGAKADPIRDPIQVSGGLVTGATLADGVRAYKGIPYAKPPVGDLRWRPPEPVASWSGTRAADNQKYYAFWDKVAAGWKGAE
jgi:para-nitrobenzyl esterase